jgi:hypothetical protein
MRVGVPCGRCLDLHSQHPWSRNRKEHVSWLGEIRHLIAATRAEDQLPASDSTLLGAHRLKHSHKRDARLRGRLRGWWRCVLRSPQTAKARVRRR